MGCGASSQKNGSDDVSPRGGTSDPRQAAAEDHRASGTVDPTSRTPGRSTIMDGQTTAHNGAGTGTTGTGAPAGTAGATPGTHGTAATGAGANTTGAGATTTGNGDTNGATAVNLHTITDLRGCRVTTVIQNRNKVETMCRWLDNVIRFRDDNHGVFPSPNRAGAAAMNPSTRDGEPPRGDTASVSSRGGVLGGRAGNEMSTYSQGFLGVSTTMQSQGANMTTAAMQGSEGAPEESSMTPIRPPTGHQPPLQTTGATTPAPEATSAVVVKEAA
mmetsp:Transcript_32484/g.37568  ORF Transcript_32484/g.37568 Transcript_32484/m.37568 type:complete len:273 (-) Transcript_32484:269-1087(-)